MLAQWRKRYGVLHSSSTIDCINSSHLYVEGALESIVLINTEFKRRSSGALTVCRDAKSCAENTNLVFGLLL